MSIYILMKIGFKKFMSGVYRCMLFAALNPNKMPSSSFNINVAATKYILCASEPFIPQPPGVIDGKDHHDDQGVERESRNLEQHNQLKTNPLYFKTGIEARTVFPVRKAPIKETNPFPAKKYLHRRKIHR